MPETRYCTPGAGMCQKISTKYPVTEIITKIGKIVEFEILDLISEIFTSLSFPLYCASSWKVYFIVDAYCTKERAYYKKT